MPNYIRAFMPGGTFFFTVVTYRRRPLFAVAGAEEILARSIEQVKVKRPFEIVAHVTMPDHLHAI